MKIVIFPLVSYTTKYTFDTLMGYEKPYQQTIHQVFGAVVCLSKIGNVGCIAGEKPEMSKYPCRMGIRQ